MLFEPKNASHPTQRRAVRTCPIDQVVPNNSRPVHRFTSRIYCLLLTSSPNVEGYS
jgi:hypothetical protein